MTYTDIGTYGAEVVPDLCDASANPESVCPFSDRSIDENALGAELFPEATPHPQIGRYLATYAGAVAEGEYRALGSSGGLVTWLLSQMLNAGIVDGVAHVRPREPTKDDDRLFAFALSHTAKDLREGSKSRYYPVEMSQVLTEIAGRPGRYAVVGVPCFIKAVRLLQRQQPKFAERISVTIGLVCGHLKSAAFAQFLAWQMGVHPDSLKAIDFRFKLEDQPANKYGVRVWSRQGIEPVTTATSELFGSNWGLGLFKYRACDFCDDVLAETADVSVGDAWLSRYVQDSRGTNVVVARTTAITQILSKGTLSGALILDEISADDVAASQTAGLRHRREGLAYRLWRYHHDGIWHPSKRVIPSRQQGGGLRPKIYTLREELAIRSHTAFREAKEQRDVKRVRLALDPWLRAYEKAYRPNGLRTLTRRLVRWLPIRIRKLARRLWMR